MKKLLFTAIIGASLLSSCGGGCDTSSVEGAADCLCHLMDESVVIDADDEAKMKEITEKSKKINDDIKKAIDDGKYKAEDLAKVAGERGCM